MMMMRRDEEALVLATTIILKTGGALFERAEKELRGEKMDKMARRSVYINLERWITLASQMQEVTHSCVMMKGKCRW